nr:hypothetical protein [Tanacetum cinerariifolium]
MEVELGCLSCLVPSKIIGEILKRNSLKDVFTLSASAPVIYMQQLWYTLQLADSNESSNFKLDQQDVEFTMDDLRTLLNLSQETDNIHAGFVDPPELMTIFEFLQIIGHDVKIQAFWKILHQPSKFPDILRRTNEPQHTIDDDVVVGFIIASGNVEGKGMQISDELLTKDIRGLQRKSCMMMILMG